MNFKEKKAIVTYQRNAKKFLSELKSQTLIQKSSIYLIHEFTQDLQNLFIMNEKKIKIFSLKQRIKEIEHNIRASEIYLHQVFYNKDFSKFFFYLSYDDDLEEQPNYKILAFDSNTNKVNNLLFSFPNIFNITYDEKNDLRGLRRMGGVMSFLVQGMIAEKGVCKIGFLNNYGFKEKIYCKLTYTKENGEGENQSNQILKFTMLLSLDFDLEKVKIAMGIPNDSWFYPFEEENLGFSFKIIENKASLFPRYDLIVMIFDLKNKKKK